MAVKSSCSRSVVRLSKNATFFACIGLAVATSSAQEIRAQKTSSSSNSVGVNIEVVNTTDRALANLKAQYFLDPTDHGSELVVEVDYTSAASLVKSVQKVNANLSVVSFDFGSESIPAGGKRVMNIRLHLASWGAMDLTNDYSYLGLGTTMAAAPRLALFQSGNIVFGTVPAGLDATKSAAHKIAIVNPTKSITVSSATIPVEWTVDGKRQVSDIVEDLQPGANIVFRCFEGGCAAVEVYRVDAAMVYEAGEAPPDWNSDLVSVKSLTDLAMNDRAIVRGTRFLVGGSFHEGYDAQFAGSLEAAKDVVLEDRATLRGAYALGGTSHFGSAVVVDADKGAYTASSAAMPTIDPVVGGVAVTFASGMILPPAKYAVLAVPQGSTLVLQGGSYTFSQLSFASDAKIAIEGAGSVTIDANQLAIGDRVATTFRNGSEHGTLMFRTSQSENIVIGYDSKLECGLVAPNASVKVQDRANWNGILWARAVEVGYDAVLDANAPVQGVIDRLSKRIGSVGLENLRLTSSRGVLHVSSAKIGQMKRAEVMPVWGDSGFTYMDDMGMIQNVAPYALDFSPKTPYFLDEGLKMSASDAVLVGSETVGGVDCWKVRISKYVAPWYFFAYFPENELLSGKAVVWISKDADRVVRIDLTVNDTRDLPFTAEGEAVGKIGVATYRIVPGACASLPLFADAEDVVKFRIAISADGSNTAGTGLSEIGFYQGGARVSPIVSAAGSSVEGRKILKGPKGERTLADGTKLYNPGDRVLADAWMLFNGDGVDDGWTDLSTTGDYVFDVAFSQNVRPDEIRISGPSDPAAAPTSIEVLASTDGSDWKSIGKDDALSWQSFEIKSRPLYWDRLARTCVPRSLDVTVPGLALDEDDVGFMQWSDLRVPGEIVDLYRTTANTQIMTLPDATEQEFQTKYSLLAEYKKMALVPWHTIFWQTRNGMAAGGAGVHLDFAVQEEVGLPADYFRPTHDLPKAKP